MSSRSNHNINTLSIIETLQKGVSKYERQQTSEFRETKQISVLSPAIISHLLKEQVNREKLTKYLIQKVIFISHIIVITPKEKLQHFAVAITS